MLDDQVLEQRAALDTLQELQAAPLVVAAAFDTQPIFQAVPGLIQGPAVPMPAFQTRLQASLFPGDRLIAFLAF